MRKRTTSIFQDYPEVETKLSIDRIYLIVQKCPYCGGRHFHEQDIINKTEPVYEITESGCCDKKYKLIKERKVLILDCTLEDSDWLKGGYKNEQKI